MKKIFLTVVALMVTAFFVATEFAQAADVTFSGQLRTRYEVNEQGSNTKNDFNNISDASDIVQARVRLNANVNINDSTSAFIQMQSTRQWAAGQGAALGGGTGSANASFEASDNDTSVGLHQAYFTLKNFATLPVDLKLGRQQIVLDGHRLYGHTGWTTGAQTHDALRLTHKHDNMAISFFYIAASEDGVSTQGSASAHDEIDNYVLHFNYKGLLGGNFSAIYSALFDPCGNNASCVITQPNDIYTIGFRQKGQFYGIDYRGEYYYQWGDADQDADALVGGTATGLGVDRDAFMFGVRLGKTFKNVMMKPSLTIWYDYLSGTEDSDLTKSNPEYKSFNTLFDTGHKFYGLMDLYLGVGGGGQANGTGGLGLQDIAIKAKLSPAPGWTFKADYHWFSTVESASANVRNGIGYGGNALGNELDLTLINKYNANTNIVFGFSNYTTTATFRDLRNVLGDGANWGYVMFDVKF